MTKRKTPEEKAVRKPRERVAFPLPRMPRLRQCNDPQRLCLISWSLTHLSRIARNAVATPFLRLPHEIRDRIHSELLGDRLIHLKYQFIADVSFEKNDHLYAAMHWESEGECSSPWRHNVCECDCPEIISDREMTYPSLDGDEEEASLFLKANGISS